MHQSSRSLRFLASFAAAAFVAAAPLRAQGPSATTGSAESMAPDTLVAAGPTVQRAAVGVRHADEASTRPAPAAPSTSSRSHAQALMIVGGAAILTGIVVGNSAGYAISIGGAVVGLYGLYQYLM